MACRISPKTPSRPLCKFRLTIFLVYGILPFSFYYFVISMQSAGPEVAIGFDHSASRNSNIFAVCLYILCKKKSLDDFVQSSTCTLILDTFFLSLIHLIICICTVFTVLSRLFWMIGLVSSSLKCVDFEVIKHLYIFCQTVLCN